MTNKEIYIAYLERTLIDTEKALDVAEREVREHEFYIESLTEGAAELKRKLEIAKLTKALVETREEVVYYMNER